MRERGIEPAIYYSNSNIAPEEEYARRFETIAAYAHEDGLDLIEGPYSPDAWQDCAGIYGAAAPGSEEHAQRCRMCYRMRFQDSAGYAKANGYDALGTTLSVSPYQYTDIIREELERACSIYGLTPFFEDYSPLYSQATRRSKEAGMYRQGYCGCLYSKAEAEADRKKRAAEKEHRRAIREKAEAEIAARRAERAEYDMKQARKKQILKKLREERNSSEDI